MMANVMTAETLNIQCGLYLKAQVLYRTQAAKTWEQEQYWVALAFKDVAMALYVTTPSQKFRDLLAF